MIEINLVPDVKQELIKAQRIRSTIVAVSIVIGLVSIGVVAVLAVYIFGVQTVRGAIADKDINDKGAQYTKTTDLSKTLTMQNQLSKITDLNNNKKIDSRTFDLLNVIIPPAPNNVQVSDMTVDSSSSTITINGQASNSYAAVEVFKKTLEGAKVKFTDADNKSQTVTLASSISTSNTSYGEDSSGVKVLRFTLSFTYAEELFSPNSKKVSIVITTNGNVTDSYLGVPQSIFPNSVFTDRATDLTGSK